MREFKVVILGPGGVGKSALTVQFITGKFVERYDPTVEDFYRKEIEVDGDPAILEILDTAGTEQFASMRDLYIKNGQGFIIVYSLTSKQSFQDVKLIRDQILRVKGSDRVPIVLAANKCDMETHREVSSEEGCLLANEWSVPYMETSAKNSTIVNSLFTEIVKEMNLKAIGQNGSNRKEKKTKLKKINNSPPLSAKFKNEKKLKKECYENENFFRTLFCCCFRGSGRGGGSGAAAAGSCLSNNRRLHNSNSSSNNTSNNSEDLCYNDTNNKSCNIL